jgi:hypothetical protein
MSIPCPNGAEVNRLPSFELRFCPSTDLITIVRQFVENFYLKVLDDPETSSRLALTTHELLENAAKYSVDGAAQLFVQVDLEKGIVEVRATNRAAMAQVARLRLCFEEISAAPDAAVLYAAMLRRSAALASGSGGLGLARIWAESEMSIRLDVRGDEVAIHACGPLATTH